MFSHSFRLILPNPVEALDLRTDDPFLEPDSFRETEIVRELDSKVFSVFEDEKIEWKMKPAWQLLARPIKLFKPVSVVYKPSFFKLVWQLANGAFIIEQPIDGTKNENILANSFVCGFQVDEKFNVVANYLLLIYP